MLEKPEVLETDPRPAAVIHLRIPRSVMQEAFGSGVDELMGVLADQDIEPAGPVFAHHLSMDPDSFDFELGVPVAETVEPRGRVKPGAVPAMTAARAVYVGPYEGLPDAWGEFDAWIGENGHEPDPDVWESYLTGPHSSSDPSTWRTELKRPLSRTAERS